jgi:hypothetical protein
MKSLPTEKPILFNGPMVRAILDGRKTMTRRVIKTKAFLEWVAAGFSDEFTKNPDNLWAESSPYRPGMKLWVRETWRRAKGNLPDGIEYRADNLLVWFDGNEPQKAREDIQRFPRDGKWRPSIFMPRWASRITLEVTGVRVERLQEISDDNALAEGYPYYTSIIEYETGDAKAWFSGLWDSLNGKTCPWASNPFVWVVEFKKVPFTTA